VKGRSIAIISVLMVVAPAVVVAAKTDNISAPTVKIAPASSDLTQILDMHPQIPLGPPDIINDYESAKFSIYQRLSQELTVISKAVAEGQIKREQGEDLSRERYELAMMQFEVLSACEAMLEEDMDHAESEQDHQISVVSGNAVVLELPFSSFELNPSLARYLELSPGQEVAIRELLSSERRQIAPLMTELRATRDKLLVLAAQPHPDHQQFNKLSGVEAQQLTGLIIANSRLQAKISDLLTAEQRGKLQHFKQESEASEDKGK
jgi:hypothetical protein